MPVIARSLLVLQALHVSVAIAAPENLALLAVPYAPAVVERLPLVVHLKLQNTGTKEMRTIFPVNQPDVLGDRAILNIRNSHKEAFRITYRGGPLDETIAPIAVH